MTTRAQFLYALLIALGAAVAHARPYAPSTPASAASAASQRGQSVREDQLLQHGSYRSKDGSTVHAPARSKTGAAPDGASAKCRDETYSFSKHRSGTCSRHGGVGEWL